MTIVQVMAELRDYEDQPDKYKPTVRKAKVLEHDRNEFKTYRQLYRKQIVTVVIDADFDDVYEMLDAPKGAPFYNAWPEWFETLWFRHLEI